MNLKKSPTLRIAAVAVIAGAAIVGISALGTTAATAAPLTAASAHANGTQDYSAVNNTGHSLIVTITTAKGETFEKNIAGLWKLNADFEGTNKITMTYPGQSEDTVVFEGRVTYSADGGWQKPVIDSSKIVVKWTTGANGSIVAVQ